MMHGRKNIKLHVPTQCFCRPAGLHAVVIRKKNCSKNLYNRKKSPVPRAGKRNFSQINIFLRPK